MKAWGLVRRTAVRGGYGGSRPTINIRTTRANALGSYDRARNSKKVIHREFGQIALFRGFTSIVIARKRDSAPRKYHSSARFPDLHRGLEVDRNKLRNAAFGHGHAEQPVHARHGDRIVGDDDEAGVGRAGHFVEQVAEPLHIVVVQRGVDLVQHADRRRIGQKHRKNQGQSGKGLLALNVKKYVIGSPMDLAGIAAQQRYPNNTYMMRLAEMYLIYVEAAIGNNPSTSDATAIDYFNRVHTRAGLAPYVVAGPNGSGPLTLDMLLSERFKEFAMEGMSWYDMVNLHYWNPTKAFSILNSQDRGLFFTQAGSNA